VSDDTRLAATAARIAMISAPLCANA